MVLLVGQECFIVTGSKDIPTHTKKNSTLMEMMGTHQSDEDAN
jgi:hypothetical protein